MNKEHYILVRTVCTHYALEQTFIYGLGDKGLINIVTSDPDDLIHEEDLPRLEKILRIHRELAVDVDAMEVVLNLVDKIDQLQEELTLLKNRISFWEPGV